MAGPAGLEGVKAPPLGAGDRHGELGPQAVAVVVAVVPDVGAGGPDWRAQGSGGRLALAEPLQAGLEVLGGHQPLLDVLLHEAGRAQHGEGSHHSRPHQRLVSDHSLIRATVAQGKTLIEEGFQWNDEI